MAKKQATIYLQSDVYCWLVGYKERNGLSNISVAIERLILERIFQEQGNLNMNVNVNNANVNVKPKEKPIETKATKLLKNIKGAMAD